MKITGHCLIKDENGNIILDSCNDVHPGNMARVIARGLAHESNYWINSIRFGNMGTYRYDDSVTISGTEIITKNHIILIAPDEFKLTHKSASINDFKITKDEFTNKKLSTTIIPDLNNLILDTDYSLSFKNYSDTSIQPIISNASLPAEELQILPNLEILRKKIYGLGSNYGAYFSNHLTKYESDYIKPYLDDKSKERWLIGEKVTENNKVSNKLYTLISRIKSDISTFQKIQSVSISSEFSTFISFIEKLFKSKKLTIDEYSCIIDKIEIIKTYTEPTHQTYNIEYIHRTPNDGISPDYAGWESSLYNEIYREYLDDSTNMVSSGKYADPLYDSSSLEHSVEGPGVVSIDDITKSRVVVNCCLNINEPSNQMIDGGVFKFDEIALYSGTSSSSWSGYQLVNVSNDYNKENTGLLKNHEYIFDIMVGTEIRNIKIVTPIIGTGIDDNISYHDLLLLLNKCFNDVVVDIVNESLSPI
jgi:hypothetical protein